MRGNNSPFPTPNPPSWTNDRISKILNRKLATPFDPKPRLLPISPRNSHSKERAAQLCFFFSGLWRHVSTRSLLSLSINYFLSFVVVVEKARCFHITFTHGRDQLMVLMSKQQHAKSIWCFISRPLVTFLIYSIFFFSLYKYPLLCRKYDSIFDSII